MINDPKIAARLQKLNCGVAVRYEAPSYKENELTGKPVQVSTGCVHADVFDLTVKATYATAKAESEPLAIEAALKQAEESPKPLTPAQLADVEANRSETIKLKKLIKELEAKLAATGQVPPPMPPANAAPAAPAQAVPTKGRGGRPKKTPPAAPASTPPPPETPDTTQPPPG